VAVWRKEIILNYVDKFLRILRNAFEESFKEIRWKGMNWFYGLDDTIIDAPDFSSQFQAAFERWNRYVEIEEAKGKVMTSFEETDRGKKIKKTEKAKDKDAKDNKDKEPEV
jgi:hypothetical protein